MDHKRHNIGTSQRLCTAWFVWRRGCNHWWVVGISIDLCLRICAKLIIIFNAIRVFNGPLHRMGIWMCNLLDGGYRLYQRTLRIHLLAVSNDKQCRKFCRRAWWHGENLKCKTMLSHLMWTHPCIVVNVRLQPHVKKPIAKLEIQVLLLIAQVPRGAGWILHLQSLGRATNNVPLLMLKTGTSCFLGLVWYELLMNWY